jgi:hypothetical protein
VCFKTIRFFYLPLISSLAKNRKILLFTNLSYLSHLNSQICLSLSHFKLAKVVIEIGDGDFAILSVTSLLGFNKKVNGEDYLHISNR